jgi:hypothetical protein
MRSSVDVENSHHGLVIVIAYECPEASCGLGARGWVRSLGRSKASAKCRGWLGEPMLRSVGVSVRTRIAVDESR